MNKDDSKDSTKDQENQTDWHAIRERNSDAYKKIFVEVEEYMIINEKFFFLKKLHFKNVRLLKDVDSILSNFGRPRIFKEKLLKKISNAISIVTFSDELLVKLSKLALHKYYDLQNMHDNETLQKAALIFHKSIKDIECKKLSTPVTTEDLIRGECDIPEVLEDFYFHVVAGENLQRANSSKTNRIVSSLSQDTTYAVPNASIKPKKRITLGIAIKGLTNSRKVLEILNRYGLCCSYSK